MNFSTGSCFAIVLIIIAVFLSGCSGSTVPEPAGVQPPGSPAIAATAATPAASMLPTAPAATAAATESPIRIFGDYRWAEYRNNITQTLPPNPRYQWEMQERVEHSETEYSGIPAVRDRITQTADYPEWVGDTLVTTKNGDVTVADMYFSVATGELLGGSMIRSVKGIAEPADVIRPDPAIHCGEKPSYFMGITPFGEMNISLSDTGTEDVTVPAGNYRNARKFTGRFRDGTTVTFWVVPGIPVPVQYQFPNKYLDGIDPFQSYELEGWG